MRNKFEKIIIVVLALSVNLNAYTFAAQKPVLRKKIYSNTMWGYKKANSDLSNDSRKYLELANESIENENYEKGLSYLMIAKDLNKKSPEILFALGKFHLERRNYITALKYLKESAKYEKKPSYTTHLLLGNLYEKLAEIDKAKNEYNIALKIKPNDEKVLLRYKYIENL